jgi:hypothetical protein
MGMMDMAAPVTLDVTKPESVTLFSGEMMDDAM